VATALVKAGLFPKEAQAMVNTWETSYFRTPGLRLLYILPRPIVDDVIPIQIKPAPEQLVRVMVGRVEVLTPETERRIENALANLESAIPAERNKAAEELNHLGRIKDPVLHRIAALAVKPEVRARAEGLLKPLAQQ
jgi:hypothetical protein